MTYRFEEQKITGGIGADDEFWRGLEEGLFKLPRCRNCNRSQWPAHFRCGHCGSWELRWITLPPVGRIFTWTRSHYAFDRVRERADDIPYVTAVVEVDGSDGARVIGMLAGSSSGLKIGAQVNGLIMPPSAKTKGYPSICWRLDAAEMSA